MKIVICGSCKFKKEINDATKKLEKAGHIVFCPILNINPEIDDLADDLKRYSQLGLTHHHFAVMRKADICLIVNKGGYIGNSVTMELGFATALDIPIYAIAKDKDEPYRGVLFDFIVEDIDDFVSKVSPKK